MAPRKRKSRKTLAKNPKRVKEDESHSNWLKAVSDYVSGTETTILILANKGLTKEKVKAVLNFLPNSQITNLHLEFNHLKDGMADLAPLLTRTKINKLNVSNCELTKDDVLQLVEVLKDTQITDLVMCEVYFDKRFSLDEASKFVAHLQESKLTTLQFDSFFNKLFPETDITSLVQEFLNTSLNCLDLNGNCSVDLASLLTSLSHSSVIDLNLTHNDKISEAVKELSQKLVETKIEKLNLNVLVLNNDTSNILFDGLVGSKVTELGLRFQNFNSLEPLLTKLKDTQIKTIDLGFNKYNLRHETFLYPDCLRYSCLDSLCFNLCELRDEQGAGLMESLKHSNVTKLDLSWNDLGSLTVKKLAENISDMKLVDLDISHNDISLDGFFMLGGCLKESKLTRLNVSDVDRGNYIPRNETVKSRDLLSFLELTEGSPVRQIEMNEYPSSWNCPLGCEPKMLMNTNFTELHLSSSKIGDNVSDLVCFLKCSSVFRLNLSHNGISDIGVVALIEGLKATQIRSLNLNKNLITSKGAKDLALSLNDTNLLYLHLSQNKIEDDGFEFLAENMKDSFVTESDVSRNPGKKVVSVDRVLWDNKVKVHSFIDFFQKITPQPDSLEFRFDQNLAEFDESSFVEKLMEFHKTVTDKPSAITVLLEEKSVSYSRAEIRRLLFEEFPRQFSLFVACSIEADMTQRLGMLEKADKMSLTAIVESLLLHRPVFMIDEEQGILHPLVYRLLLKYKQPVCNIDVEPDGVTKIIEYFTQHADIESSQDLISLLRDANIS